MKKLLIILSIFIVILGLGTVSWMNRDFIADALGIDTPIATYSVSTHTEDGQSMFPTISVGDEVCFVDSVTPINRGDLVMFNAPDILDRDNSVYIKRVIGLPGETIILEGGDVYFQRQRGQTLLDESSYLDLDEVRTFKAIRTRDEMKVVEPELAEDEYYLLGDNRSGSADSRISGPIESSEFFGKVFKKAGVEGCPSEVTVKELEDNNEFEVEYSI
jgi:signal peptidase I